MTDIIDHIVDTLNHMDPSTDHSKYIVDLNKQNRKTSIQMEGGAPFGKEYPAKLLQDFHVPEYIAADWGESDYPDTPEYNFKVGDPAVVHLVFGGNIWLSVLAPEGQNETIETDAIEGVHFEFI